jgi:hypothetical protein
MTGIDAIFYNGALSTVGDPNFLGILVWVFFAIFVMLQNLPTSAKIAIMVPATMLALALLNSTGWVVLAGLSIAVIVYFGFRRFGR